MSSCGPRPTDCLSSPPKGGFFYCSAIDGRTPAAGEMRSLRLARQAREPCMRENVLCSFHLQLVRRAGARRRPLHAAANLIDGDKCFDPFRPCLSATAAICQGSALSFRHRRVSNLDQLGHGLAVPRFVVSMPQEAPRGHMIRHRAAESRLTAAACLRPNGRGSGGTSSFCLQHGGFGRVARDATSDKDIERGGSRVTGPPTIWPNILFNLGRPRARRPWPTY